MASIQVAGALVRPSVDVYVLMYARYAARVGLGRCQRSETTQQQTLLVSLSGPKKNDWGKMRTAEVEVAVTEAAEGVAPTRSELKRGGTAGLAEIDEALRSLAHRRLRMRQSCSYWLHAPPLARFRACDAGM